MISRRLSVVFLTYNRSDLLTQTVFEIKNALALVDNLEFETIVSDDCSDPPHQATIARLPVDRILNAERNQGLSANHNKALAACKYEYILSLQDDWKFIGNPQSLRRALDVLDTNPQVGVVNLMAHATSLEHQMQWLDKEMPYIVFENDGDSKRLIADRPYSDRPHVKRHEFIGQIGPYREDLPMTLAEYDFKRRVACQDRWKIACLLAPSQFVHLGAERSFNPGTLRARRLETQFRIPVIGPLYKAIRKAARRCRRVYTSTFFD